MSDIKFSLLVLGAGGTGTYFLKEFSRFIAGNPLKKRICSMTIFDGDIVEEKNLSRQAFDETDLGMNKASAMADALYSAFNVKWSAVGEYVLRSEQLSTNIICVPIIVGCVDNHACRLVCEEFFASKQTCFYLDSANEYDTGEVVFAYKAEGKVISPVRSHYFPKIKEKSKSRVELSCEELNNVSPQHIATNMAAGNILLNEVCSILDGKPHPGLVTFDLSMYSQEYIKYKEAA